MGKPRKTPITFTITFKLHSENGCFNTSKNDHLQFEHGWFFSFYVHSENFIALSAKQSGNQKMLSKRVRFFKQIV